jgi:hypothetical protein
MENELIGVKLLESKWEYSEVLESETIINPPFLDEMGKEGWELVSVIQVRNMRLKYIFKRPLI